MRAAASISGTRDPPGRRRRAAFAGSESRQLRDDFHRVGVRAGNSARTGLSFGAARSSSRTSGPARSSSGRTGRARAGPPRATAASRAALGERAGLRGERVEGHPAGPDQGAHAGFARAELAERRSMRRRRARRCPPPVHAAPGSDSGARGYAGELADRLVEVLRTAVPASRDPSSSRIERVCTRPSSSRKSNASSKSTLGSALPHPRRRELAGLLGAPVDAQVGVAEHPALADRSPSRPDKSGRTRRRS